MDTSDYTVKISCDCDTCKINATKIGQPFPLTALVRPVLADGLGLKGKKATKAHGLVYAAHDPSLRGHKGLRASIPA